ncbi:cytochrome c [Candidatus Sumerlaeota bacterium]|nr:cytochrome c [Candidatus Sumerlaeota bacterium]
MSRFPVFQGRCALSRVVRAFTLMAVVVGLSSCKPNTEQREIEWMPDMYRNQAVKPQEESDFFKTGSGMLMPPKDTVPVGFTRYPYRITEGVKAGDELVNPLPRTREVLEIGRKYFDIHCIVCHGPVGSGDGLATLAKRENGMPVPPQLYSEKIRTTWKDGQIYHTITMGQGQMPPYASRIEPIHRWAIVHYVRALGEAAAPTEADLKLAESKGLKAKDEDAKLSTLKPEGRREFESVFTLKKFNKEEK